MKKLNYCRCCKSKDLLLYLNLGKQPLANTYHTGKRLPTYPLEVMVCLSCFHNQLSVVVDPKLMFENYLYVSGTTETFRNHCKNLAYDAIKRIPKKNVRVLDIACNDGTQLEYFRDLGAEVFGVDPAENLREITQKKHIPVVVDYWNMRSAKKLHKKFDLITGTNVFAHVNNVDEFLETCFYALEDKGILVLEFPYCDKMITYNEFDTVYHEHLSYFLVNSFFTLASRMNFKIIDLLQTPIHGGSIRFFLQKGNGKHSKKVSKLIEKERNHKLFNIKTYTLFAKKVAKNKEEMKKLIKTLKEKKKKVIGYGASAKGNTMLNYFKIDLDYIIDDNPLKQNLYTPGRNIPIKSSDVLKNELGQLHILILSWNFYNNIAKNLRKIRDKKYNDNSIFYVPVVKSLSLQNTYNSLPTA